MIALDKRGVISYYKSMKTTYSKPDEPLTIEATCAACNESITIGQGVFRFFGDEEQIATQTGRSGRYPVHADECPANLKRETVTMIGEHVVVTKRSKNPKFPIMATVDGKSTGRVYKNAFVAITKIRQELA